MSHDAISVARYQRHHHMSPTGSGPLGPLDPPFANMTGEDIFSQSLALDLLEREKRFLQDRIQECQALLEQSTQMLAELNERRVKAAAELREIETNPSNHPRQLILRVCHELREAEIAHTRMSEQCGHLERQLDLAQRALAAIESSVTLANEAIPQEPTTDPFADEAEEEEPQTAEIPRVRSDQIRPLTSTPSVDMPAMLTAREYERHVLARNIDERVRFVISDAVLMAELCETALRTDPQNSWRATEDLKNRLNEALRGIDTLIFELEPITLNDMGLVATLQRYTHSLIETYRAPIAVQVSGIEKRFHIAVERAVFRAAREALTNALRHSRAQSITVALSQRQDMLVLSVEDDGVGFDVDATMAKVRRGYHSGLGQICIEADLLGAEFGIESGNGRGTRILYIVTGSPRTGFLTM